MTRIVHQPDIRPDNGFFDAPPGGQTYRATKRIPEPTRVRLVEDLPQAYIELAQMEGRLIGALEAFCDYCGAKVEGDVVVRKAMHPLSLSWYLTIEAELDTETPRHPLPQRLHEIAHHVQTNAYYADEELARMDAASVLAAANELDGFNEMFSSSSPPGFREQSAALERDRIRALLLEQQPAEGTVLHALAAWLGEGAEGRPELPPEPSTGFKDVQGPHAVPTTGLQPAPEGPPKAWLVEGAARGNPPRTPTERCRRHVDADRAPRAAGSHLRSSARERQRHGPVPGARSRAASGAALMMTVKEAATLAAQAHRGQLDRDGEEHFEHVMRVFDMVRGRYSMEDPARARVALLHDVLEDTDVSIPDLEAAGLPEVEIKALKLLTRLTADQARAMGIDRPTYRGYIWAIVDAAKKGLPEGLIACDVKECDTLDNIGRCLDACDTMVKRYAISLSLIWEGRTCT